MTHCRSHLFVVGVVGSHIRRGRLLLLEYLAWHRSCGNMDNSCDGIPPQLDDDDDDGCNTLSPLLGRYDVDDSHTFLSNHIHRHHFFHSEVDSQQQALWSMLLR